jgi:hypothetical protein
MDYSDFDDYRLLGDLDGSKVGTIIGTGGAIGGKAVTAIMGTSAAAGPVGMAVGLVASVIAMIFGAHAAKVAREDEVTGVWAATGQKAIDEVMSLWRAGKVPKSETIAGLQSIESQFQSLTSQVVKTGGKFGVFPNPEAPRPSRDCNASCGLYYELHHQIKGLIAEVQSGQGGGGLGGGLSSLLGGSNMPLLLAGVALFLFMKK